MRKAELSEALKLAQSDADLSKVDDSVLDGLYLRSFPAPVTTTIQVVAKMLRWHVICLNGQVDAEALDEFARVGKPKIIVV